ncbi:hypothetical protein DFP72DRAFT_955551 [Ephemerocybe angulata]|uniref:F-box domain-containing protein n=1 Tax=Ephemerocybe angulata TaxID=980116 RepID=A0A8H6MFQ7_9AGAR|nr:hypothetical protein DFP72DRAFT_955551 [Tulosesus angulatus]
MDSAQDPTPAAGSFRFSSEIIIQILRFLGPTDILSMRKTCRMMHRVTKYRVVWLEALERVCEKYGIFKPTFPMEKMSILRLEHASTGPTRFLAGVKIYQPDDCVRPYITRTPHFRRERCSYDSYSYDTFHLVPGGRFLFTSASNTVCLFDLGYSMNVPVESLPLATLKGFGELKAVAPTMNGKELLVATIKGSPVGAPASKILYIHQINPNHRSKDLRFCCKGKMELHFGPQARTLTGSIRLTSTFALFKRNEEFVYWNWEGNTGCRWPASGMLYFTPLYAFKDTVMACGTDAQLCVYDIPTATSLLVTDHARPTQLQDLETLTNEPKALFSPPDNAFDGAHMCTPSVWCENSTLDPHLCLIYPTDDTPCLQLYSIKPLPGSESPFLPRSLPVRGGCATDVYGDNHSSSFHNLLPSIFRCDDELVICTTSNEHGLLMSILPVPSKATQEEFTPTAVALVPAGSLMEDIERYQFAFCPMSGRVVYFGSSGMSDDVRVVDYLLPPEEPLQEP